ncbi:MAG: glycosyltransferase family 39 protein [Undibacterium sp.]|nr:glycosyltransferase family 39 protein [Opitutaceae bacterium]
MAASLAALLLGFVLIPDLPAITFVSRTGFWFVLVAFVIFVGALWQSFRAEISQLHWRRLDGMGWVVVGLGSALLMVHETFGFKIVMDEIMLLGTSMSMHFDKTVLTPVRGNDIQGTFVILDGMMDKRPLFFPFLVSLLHDLTGYRPANSFVLNGILTFVFLSLVNHAGRRLAGRTAGWLGVALCAGLPLLAHNATGGGFELLNLVMILGTLLLGARWVERRDEAAMVAFCFSALLLAQVRYESVIYLLPVAGLVLWGWWREGRLILPWPVIIAPLLMIHYPLQHRIFDLRASAWEMGSQPGYTTPFSPAYIADNLYHAFGFFFAKPTDQPNSLLLSSLGLIAVPFFGLALVKWVRSLPRESPITVATAFFAAGFAVQFALMMCYFWGRFDDPVIRRLSLPTHLGLVIAVLAVLPQLAGAAAIRGLLALAAIAVVCVGVPSMAAHAYSQEYLPGRETAWRRGFIAEQPRHDYLMIDNDSILWITHQVSSTPIVQARRRRADLVFHLRNRTFSDMFVFQRFNIDPETGRKTLRKDDELGPEFELETVREERLQTLTLDRISRIKSIKTEAGVASGPATADFPVPKDRAEIERQRRAYLENFLKQLP